MGTLRFARNQLISNKITSASFLVQSNVNSSTDAMKKIMPSSTIVPKSFCKLVVDKNCKNNSFIPKVPLDYIVSRKTSTTSKLMSFNEPFKPLEQNDPNICWKCQIDLRTENEKGQLNNLLTCPCPQHVLRSIPKSIDHFELFGLERKFKMDLKNLAQKYKSMQRILHPDR